jgi:hypothetical protein
MFPCCLYIVSLSGARLARTFNENFWKPDGQPLPGMMDVMRCSDIQEFAIILPENSRPELIFNNRT